MSRNVVNPAVYGASENLIAQTTHIVIGEVESIESKWNETDGTVDSYVRIYAENFLKGNSTGSKIVVKHKGGEVEGIGLLNSAEPRFLKGEKVKVFLKLLKEPNEFVVVGGKQGKISLSLNASAGYIYDGIHWSSSDLPINYYINEIGTSDVPGTAAEFAAVQASFQTWEDDAGSYMDYSYIGTTTRSGASQDGFNVVSWEPIDGSGGTLAETSFWYDSATKLLFEVDIVFDEDETWSASGEAGKNDIQNVGTHEAGHTLVLNDLYDPADSEETMYGYSSAGETKKRDLYTGDIAGIRFIYGLATITYTIDTNPSGLQIEVDGANYTTPYSFSWFSGSDHIVNAFSPENGDVGTRYVFERWSDGGGQLHAIRVGTSNTVLTADYTVQYKISVLFETDDRAQTIYPSQIQIFGGPPNNTLIILTAYSSLWLDDVQWMIREILWQENNVVSASHPATRLSANFEWTVKCRVYLTSFASSFRDKGLSLSIKPSSFQLEFPNGTVSNPLNPSNVYYIQNGTTAWNSITWQSAEVVPTNTVFDATDGNPTVNCLIYNFTIRVTDMFNIPVAGASVSATLPNRTTVRAPTRTDGTATFTRIPQGQFTAQVSYMGQTATVRGDVAQAAVHTADAKITMSLPILLLILFPTVLASFLILVVAKRRISAPHVSREV